MVCDGLSFIWGLQINVKKKPRFTIKCECNSLSTTVSVILGTIVFIKLNKVFIINSKKQLLFLVTTGAFTQIHLASHIFTYQRPLVPNPQRQPWARVFLRRSHWRTCWRSHHHRRWSCRWASVRPAGCRAPNSRAPSRHCPSARQPGRYGLRCTHAEEKNKHKNRS